MLGSRSWVRASALITTGWESIVGTPSPKFYLSITSIAFLGFDFDFDLTQQYLSCRPLHRGR